jgi:hypothetical protein
MWIDGANLKYLDSTLNERTLPLGSASTPTDVASAINGSTWVENNRLNSVEGSTKQKREYHTDVAHQDEHGDTEHGDSAHSDQFTDTHTDSHSDVAFSDNHGDISGIGIEHTDSGYYTPHQDSYSDTHGDFPHSDIAHDDVSHFDLTINVSFANAPEFVGNI